MKSGREAGEEVGHEKAQEAQNGRGNLAARERIKSSGTGILQEETEVTEWGGRLWLVPSTGGELRRLSAERGSVTRSTV